MAGTRPKGSAKRKLLLDTAEKLIVEEGYAAISTRRVAQEAGLKAPLVHYYFPTTEDLLLAVYERAAEQAHQRVLDAFSAERPLEAFWKLSTESAHTSLGTEFFALANHRKSISGEIARKSPAVRRAEAEALARAMGSRLDRSICDPVALVILLTGISRVLVMEESMGVTEGHAETKALIAWLLQHVVRDDPDQAAETTNDG